MDKLVSVIVPAYNQGNYLPVALNAVLAQTYTHWECIIVNDGSPDNSEEIALNYCAKDSRFKYLKKENGGLSSARNAGLKIATGGWVQFLDSDDYIEPEKLKLSIELAAENPGASLIVSDFKMFKDDPRNATAAYCDLNQERLSFESILLKWDSEFNIPIHSGFFKADIFSDPAFVETLRNGEDWVMWLDVFQKNIKAVYLDQPLAYYRINPNSTTKDRTFARTALTETYKYIIPLLPPLHAHKFVGVIFDRLNDTIFCYEKDLKLLRAKPFYKMEKGAKDMLRKILIRKIKR